MAPPTPVKPTGTDPMVLAEMITLTLEDPAAGVMTRLTGVDPHIPYDWYYEDLCAAETGAAIGKPLAHAYCSGLKRKMECQPVLQRCFLEDFKAIAERFERSIAARKVLEAKDPKSEVEKLTAGNEDLFDTICRGGLELYDSITGTHQFPLVEQFCRVFVSSSTPMKTADVSQTRVRENKK